MILDLVLAVVNKKSDEHQTGGGLAPSTAIWAFVSLVFLVSAVALSWDCNTKAGTDMLTKVLYAVGAAVFSHFYLIFYFVYRIILKNSCSM